MRNILVFCLALVLAPFAAAQPTPALQESSFWKMEINKGDLPPIEERIPETPLIVDLPAKGRSFGRQGGTLRTMVSRAKDVRQMVIYGYARLVGYDTSYELYPDILRDIEIEDDRKFTMHLRPGHRWSDGAPFTSFMCFLTAL